ncbi:GNAT family N-acetyltransferase [Sphingomonas flavalba]|uniref:GNAT family N-acetyltransferase n=1 Tax=Sphingomonas flavalba TaxID=2559804 RepID=UPI00109DEA0F|nr:GNAT family N-acetyltransferase [Sphingomonas flavalba]
MFARTDRLLLRPGWAEDAPALHAAIAEPAVVRNLARAPWPYRLTDAQAFLAGADTPLPTCLMFARTHGAPRLVGGVGLHPAADGRIELGFWVARRFWGLGYATEAGQAMLAAARDTLRLSAIEAVHFVDNPAAGRVLHKLGFRPIGCPAPRFSAGRGEAAPSRRYISEGDGMPCDGDMPQLKAA